MPRAINMKDIINHYKKEWESLGTKRAEAETIKWLTVKGIPKATAELYVRTVKQKVLDEMFRDIPN